MPADLDDAGKSAWRTIWRSPIAEHIADVDVPVVERLCRMYDRMAKDGIDHKDYVSLAKAALQLETALGITSGARARLGIKLTAEKKATLSSIRGELAG